MVTNLFYIIYYQINIIGDVYIGNLKNGLKHGKGIEYYSNGDIY